MTVTADRSSRDIAAERYGQRFAEFPPMFYLNHLDDAAFVAIIDKAIASGAQIDPEQFEAGLADTTLL